MDMQYLLCMECIHTVGLDCFKLVLLVYPLYVALQKIQT